MIETSEERFPTVEGIKVKCPYCGEASWTMMQMQDGKAIIRGICFAGCDKSMETEGVFTIEFAVGSPEHHRMIQEICTLNR